MTGCSVTALRAVLEHEKERDSRGRYIRDRNIKEDLESDCRAGKS